MGSFSDAAGGFQEVFDCNENASIPFTDPGRDVLIPAFQGHGTCSMDRDRLIRYADLGTELDSERSSASLGFGGGIFARDILSSPNSMRNSCDNTEQNRDPSTRGIDSPEHCQAGSLSSSSAKACRSKARLTSMCAAPTRQGSSIYDVKAVLDNHTSGTTILRTDIEAGHAIRLLLFSIDASLVASQVWFTAVY